MLLESRCGASETGAQEREAIAKLDNLSLIPRIHMVEEEN